MVSREFPPGIETERYAYTLLPHCRKRISKGSKGLRLMEGRERAGKTILNFRYPRTEGRTKSSVMFTDECVGTGRHRRLRRASTVFQTAGSAIRVKTVPSHFVKVPHYRRFLSDTISLQPLNR